MTPCWGCVDVGAMLDPSWAMLGPCATWRFVGTTSAHERAYVGPSWAKLAHLRSMLGPGSPILGLCWG